VVLPECEVWVAEADTGDVVAVLALRDNWVDQLYVAPQWTDAGIGSRLIGLAQERRPAGLQLWTFQTNVRARRFYVRHGFVEVETTDGACNEEGVPDVRMEWAGSPSCWRAGRVVGAGGRAGAR
jgi:GNAT superfamily N-acetyltransferase